MRYIVTKEIKSETQVFWIIYLQDGALLLIWVVLALMLRGHVHDLLQIPYLIFSAIIGLRLVLRTPGNPKRRYYQRIALYLSRPKHIYRYYEEGNKDEGKGNQTHQRRNTYHRL